MQGSIRRIERPCYLLYARRERDRQTRDYRNEIEHRKDDTHRKDRNMIERKRQMAALNEVNRMETVGTTLPGKFRIARTIFSNLKPIKLNHLPRPPALPPEFYPKNHS